MPVPIQQACLSTRQHGIDWEYSKYKRTFSWEQEARTRMARASLVSSSQRRRSTFEMAG